MNKVSISASILSCDYLRIGQELTHLESAGADLIHLDIMDGHFVPEISFGSSISKQVRAATNLPCEAHLMVDKPSQHIDSFIDAGCFRIIVHQESNDDIATVIQSLKIREVESGISIKPRTEIELLEPYLHDVHLVLLMTVEPGWGGQGFIAESLDRLEKLRTLREEKGLNFLIEVDGGINASTAKQCTSRGAEILVSGSFLTKAPDKAAAMTALRGV